MEQRSHNTDSLQDGTHHNLIIVAGACRNVGKTALICRLINKFKIKADLIGLKVSSVEPDYIHSQHTQITSEAPEMYEETRENSTKDTSRMLQAGANRVFYLKGDENNLAHTYKTFSRMISPSAAIISESNSLWRCVKPALLILVKPAPTPAGLNNPIIEEDADLIIVSDGLSTFTNLEHIDLIRPNRWTLR